MIEITCVICGSKKLKSLSKVSKRPCCSRECQTKLTVKNLLEGGKPYRITRKNRSKIWPKTLKALRKNAGQRNYAWKGEAVSYRGLHQWVRRKKGIPKKCSHCGRPKTDARSIQWANVDGKYHRRIEDFIALCVSCHKIYDLQR